jgi:TolB protein
VAVIASATPAVQQPVIQPTNTAIGTIIAEFTAPPDDAPTWTPSPTPEVSATPTPAPTRQPLLDYRLLFVGERKSRATPGIYEIRGDGTDEKLLISAPNGATDPAWSPDGSQIAYVASDGGAPQLFVAARDGSNAGQVITLGGTRTGGVRWSPDGRQLVFFSDTNGNFEIYTVNADGSNFIRVTTYPGDDVDPSWSPDGTRIVYAKDVTGRRALQIVLREMATGVERQLTESSGSNFHPAWSPDGGSIVFTSTRERTGDIYVMRADGSDERLLTFNDSGAENRHPAWSSDGAFIVFSSTRNGDVLNLFAMRPDGKDVQQITNADGISYEGQFRPNGF